MDEKLSYEEFHKLATAPLPIFNIINPKAYGSGRISGSYYGGAYNDYIKITTINMINMIENIKK